MPNAKARMSTVTIIWYYSVLFRRSLGTTSGMVTLRLIGYKDYSSLEKKNALSVPSPPVRRFISVERERNFKKKKGGGGREFMLTNQNQTKTKPKLHLNTLIHPYILHSQARTGTGKYLFSLFGRPRAGLATLSG